MLGSSFLTVEAITKEEVPFILKALMKTSHYDPKRPLPDGITLTFITPPQSGASMIGEMTQTAYDKGRAVDALKAFFPDHDTIVFGDSENDLSMLEAADISVAMGNAVLKVKEAADHVTDRITEDGIEHAFRHFGLI